MRPITTGVQLRVLQRCSLVPRPVLRQQLQRPRPSAGGTAVAAVAPTGTSRGSATAESTASPVRDGATATCASDADLEQSLAAQATAQKRLHDRSAHAMLIHYCRDHGGRLYRWFRGFSIDVSFDFRHWRKHQKATRHISLWTPRNTFRADNLRRLFFPDLAWIGGSSCAACYYNACVVAAESAEAPYHLPGFNVDMHPMMITLPLECFTVTSVALGLLVTFKTQMGYGRFLEGRNLWATLSNESKALASRVLNRIPSQSGEASHLVLASRAYSVKLVRSFPFALKYHLTEDGCNPHIEIQDDTPDSETRAAMTLALQAELRSIWDVGNEDEKVFVDRILATEASNRPQHILHELSYINATVFVHPALGGLDFPAATEVDRSIAILHNVLGNCEKIIRTPIYTSYTRFTSRFLWLWCSTLPLALYPMLGPLGTPPASLIIAFFMLGIEDIGSRVEQPFDVMPLWQYCQMIDQTCLQLVRHSEAIRKRVDEAISKHTEVPLPTPVSNDEDGDQEWEYEFDVPSSALNSFVDPLDMPFHAVRKR
mmetsp:Transcript_29330/g.56762  ORF Transcript_29330/g.56762 Transcript_29330/m.56762 type:complete len:542 (+) Transcript_29330:68-1693(+)